MHYAELFNYKSSKAVSKADHKSVSQIDSMIDSKTINYNKKTRGKYSTNEKVDIDKVVSVPGYIDRLVIHNSKYYPALKIVYKRLDSI